jgi:hypothetical protein
MEWAQQAAEFALGLRCKAVAPAFAMIEQQFCAK